MLEILMAIAILVVFCILYWIIKNHEEKEELKRQISESVSKQILLRPSDYKNKKTMYSSSSFYIKILGR